jgi:DNA (cytosine-5)-methyltransferase 1
LGKATSPLLQKTSAISLFSGCGGMDLGAKFAGADIKLAVDSMKAAVDSLSANNIASDALCARIEDVERFPHVDLLIGGYPCQSFSMGGLRDPFEDPRSMLYLQFARCLQDVQPKYFVAENVPGLAATAQGEFLRRQLSKFSGIGDYGYKITTKVLNAADYGVPQNRKRLFLVGVRNDVNAVYEFPSPTHGNNDGLLPFLSHGEAIKGLPSWPTGEFYELPGIDRDTFPWYYMSRNRRANWDKPSYTVVANWRHVTLHPGSPVMRMLWSNLADGFKQKWEFSDNYDSKMPKKYQLDMPRRLSWRECARLQSFPDTFVPVGSIQSKFTQIGNAVPPLLAEAVIRHLLTQKGLKDK